MAINWRFFREMLPNRGSGLRGSGLEELLSKVPGNFKEAAEIGVVVAERSNNHQYAEKASKFYEGKQRTNLTAKLAILCGNPEKAIKLLEEYDIDQAAEVAKKHVGIKRAIEIYEDAIKRNNSASDNESLAQLYEEYGDNINAKKYFRQAISLYDNNGWVNSAVRLERKYGTLENVIEIYLRATAKQSPHNSSIYYEEAAKVADEIGLSEKARNLYEKALDEKLSLAFLFNKEHIIELAKKVGNYDKLIVVYQKTGRHKDSYALAMQMGYFDFAKKISSTTKSSEILDEMAEIAIDKGHPEMAMEMYESAGMDLNAAKLALRLGYIQKALEICEPRINENDPGGYFYNARYYEIAIAAAAKIGDKAKELEIGHMAIERLSLVGEFEAAAIFAEKLSYLELAEIYKKLASLPKIA